MAVAAIFLAGCAGVSVEEPEVMASLTGLPKPPAFHVYDFAINANDVLADTTGPKFATGDGDASERLKVAQDVQAAFTAVLVKKLNDKGVYARRATDQTRPALNSLVLRGQFIRVNEGDAMSRTVVGFGAGKSELQIAIQVYQMTPTGLRQLTASEAEATGSKGPGMLVPVTAGAALGNAVRSVVISGGIRAFSELSAAIKGNVDRLSEELSERAVQFYIDRGWLDAP